MKDRNTQYFSQKLNQIKHLNEESVNKHKRPTYYQRLALNANSYQEQKTHNQ